MPVMHRTNTKSEVNYGFHAGWWGLTTLPVLNLMAAFNIGDALVNWVDIDEIDFERPFFF
jgi:hypothetical protein